MARTRIRRAVQAESGSAPADRRDAMIREAAYFLYLSSDRAPGRDLDHWLAAEALVDDRLAGESLSVEAAAILRSARAKPERARGSRGADAG